MTDRRAVARRLGRWTLYLAGWLVLALFFASQSVIYSHYAGRPVTWRQALSYPLSDALPWSLLALIAFALARRFPLERGRLARGLAVHLPAALALALVESLAAFLALDALGWFERSTVPARRLFGGMAVGKLHQNILTYAILVGCAQALDYYRKFREREVRASQLEARLAVARLEALRMQLQPHFLFNTLHAISALMHRDVEAADRMLARLSDLLRLSMEGEGEPEVPLQRELDFLAGYLEIQQARFGERLRVRVDAAPETLDARVPRLLLQPLVENAVRHGLSARGAGGTVEIGARRVGTRLRVTVRDDGAGLPATGGVREGVGLSNIRARLEALYGAAWRLELASHAQGGAIATIEVPWRPAEAGARAAGEP